MGVEYLIRLREGAQWRPPGETTDPGAESHDPEEAQVWLEGDEPAE
jgi:hypothetical protein